MKTINLTLLLVAISVITGCASTPKQDTSGMAELVVLGGGAGGFLKSVFMPLGMNKETAVILIDGEKKKKEKSKTYFLNPGQHIIIAKCTIIIDGSPIWAYGTKELIVNLKSDGKYIVDADLGEPKKGILGPKSTCVPKIVTDKNT